jgi:hypothetical protein
MTEDLDPRDPLTDRLRALGRTPVDPALQSDHLTAMAGVRGGSVFRNALAQRLKLAAGVMAGFLLGASGLTAAGALGPLQPIAAKAVEAVAPVDVPKGQKDKAKEAKAEKEQGGSSRLPDGSIGTARHWEGCVAADGGTFAGNRGRYLKQERAKSGEAFEAAKATECGKPLVSDDDEAAEATKAEEPKEPKAPKADDESKDNGKADEEHGKATAPGQTDKTDDDQGGGDSKQPETVPSLPDQASDNADPPVHAPGDPASPQEL